MAPSARVIKAFKAMKEIGIPEAKTKSALKKLLQAFEKNWDAIEAENYRVLADAIFDYEETETAEKEKKRKKPDNGELVNEPMPDEPVQDEQERPLKRLRMKHPPSPTPAVGALIIPKPEPDTFQPVSPQPLVRNKGKQVVSSSNSGASTPLGKQKRSRSNALIIPKEEPISDDSVVSIEPLAGVHPESLTKEVSTKPANQVDNEDNQTSKTVNALDKATVSNPSTEQAKQLQIVYVSDQAPPTLDIAASSLGEVKISVSYNLGSKEDEIHAPDFEAALKKVTDSCLRTYKITDPDFSVRAVMKQFCDCVVELGKSTDGKDFEVINNNGISCIPSDNNSANREILEISDNSAEIDPSEVDMNLKSIVIVHPYDTNDITKGNETVMVSLEKSNCEFLPSFNYISKNAIFDNADLKFSLAQIGEKDCCLSCHGDCLSSSSFCNCNGGESAYTLDGLVREKFIDECVSMVQNPKKDDLMYCKECPLDRMKNEDILDPCKGHLKRRFIKECYTKCGCSQHCGNRVVQRGMKCNLQVFWTPEGKGWGLRTMDNLPKGAFVCEFVGEILTSIELGKRNRSRNDKHSFSLVLDTDWGTRRALGEEKLLCLDARFYGNVARFINHRCTDANLIEIPVEVETPSHHYYHVALFTTRNVEAFEELTWDYGVDFDDSEQHIKAFQCLCSSQFCRNMKRSTRSRSALTLQ